MSAFSDGPFTAPPYLMDTCFVFRWYLAEVSRIMIGPKGENAAGAALSAHRLVEIIDRITMATPGPWRAIRDGDVWRVYGGTILPIKILEAPKREMRPNARDSALIENAWPDIRDLLAEVLRLRPDLLRLKEHAPTSGGAAVTDGLVEQAAVEAEEGYDLNSLRPRGENTAG